MSENKKMVYEPPLCDCGCGMEISNPKRFFCAWDKMKEILIININKINKY